MWPGLSPRTLLSACKNGLRSHGVKAPQHPAMQSVSAVRPQRMIPLSRLRSRLGLDRYNVSAPMTEETLTPSRVRVVLSQHIGAPAVATVAKGDRVEQGQCIADPAENALSVAIHSPVTGTVTDVTDRVITITV